MEAAIIAEQAPRHGRRRRSGYFQGPLRAVVLDLPLGDLRRADFPMQCRSLLRRDANQRHGSSLECKQALSAYPN